MRAMDLRGARGPCGTAGIVLLLALLALALSLEGTYVGHSHEAGTAGLYNAECPLAALAAVSVPGMAPLDPAWVAVALLAGAISLTTAPPLGTAVVRYTDSRAPPLV